MASNKIVAGRYINRNGRIEIISVVLPIRMFILCRYCGELASKKMYLIKQESDMDLLEEHYSSLCNCRNTS